MTERFVFDTNVWISGLIWRGKSYQCLLLARVGIVQVVYCPPALAELAEKLRGKFQFSEDHIRAVLYQIRQMGERVEISGSLRVVPDDPDDDKFIECALKGGAAYVVSSDQHLLSMKKYKPIEIITPERLVALMTHFD